MHQKSRSRCSLADGNAKLSAALLAKDLKMASIAQAVIEAGQKSVRLQDQAVLLPTSAARGTDSPSYSHATG